MEHIDPLFLNLAIILAIASVTTMLFKYLHQPTVIGYVIAGLITTLIPTKLDKHTIEVWGEIGVVFLLFALGLEFRFKKLKKVGGSGSITALTEALIMMTTGVIVGHFMGMNFISSLFLGGMLSISSTSVIIKTFEELKAKNKNFAQVVFGVLIVEDMVAILLLVLLSSIATVGYFDSTTLFAELLKLLIFLIITFTAGIFIIPTIFRKISKWFNNETLLITTIGLCLMAVMGSVKFGFSPALGAFVMGAIIAETDESEKIHTLISPIRDLFAAVFFISVGMLVEPSVITEHPFQILLLTLLVLVVKPLSAIVGILFSGRTVKMAMMSGMTLSQIGEFSFIIAALGLSLGVIDKTLYPIIVMVSIITTFTTPIYVRNSEKLYNRLNNIIPHSWKLVINNYGTGRYTLDNESEWKVLLRTYILSVAIYGGWMSVVVLFSFSFIAPLSIEYLGDSWWVRLSIVIITLVMLSPFAYWMLTKRNAKRSYGRLWRNRKYARAPLLMLVFTRYFIAATFVGVVLAKFYTLHMLFLIPSIVVICGIYIISTRLKNHYTAIETHFLRNLDKTSRKSGIAIPKKIADDIHMEYFNIDIGSLLVGMSISDVHHKYKTGAQIVSISSSECRQDLPGNTEVFSAGDKVLVVGDDGQIQAFKLVTEGVKSKSTNCPQAYNLDLYQFTISTTSKLCGCRAHTSQLRNDFQVLLVGIDCKIDGFKRPNPKNYLEEGDTVWLVGDKETVKKLV